MRKHVQLYLLAITALALLVLWGCPKKTQMTTSQETQTEKVTAPATPSVGRPMRQQGCGRGGSSGERSGDRSSGAGRPAAGLFRL